MPNARAWISSSATITSRPRKFPRRSRSSTSNAPTVPIRSTNCRGAAWDSSTVQAYCQKNGIPFQQIEPLLDLLAVSIASDIVHSGG